MSLPLLQGPEIWPVWLDPITDEAAASFRHILSPGEIAHADRLRGGELRSRYEAGRGILRLLLGHYANRRPAEIELVGGQWGKPALSESGLGFNLSHSQSLAVYGFGAGMDIGIDVELVRSFPYLEQVARHALSESEAREVVALPAGPMREAHFFHCWTRKEAFLKFTGTGLILTPPAMPYALQHFEPAPGYVGALVRTPAVDGPKATMHPATNALQILAAFG